MKKKIIILKTIPFCILFSLFLIQKSYSQTKKQEKAEKTNTSNYTGSYIKGNYIWGGAMSLAWTDLSKNIIKAPIQLNTSDKKVISLVENFNHPTFTKNDLDEKSYYIKSGFGNKTITAINLETKKKCPNKSFSDLTDNIGDKGFIAFAYFYKKLNYLNRFSVKTTTFLGKNVTGFYAENKKQNDNVSVLTYVDDDHFIISLELKDNKDQLILAKGYDMKNPSKVIETINKYNMNKLGSLRNKDEFEAPKINLNMYRNYDELIGNKLKNKNFENYLIVKMYEKIKFEMDENGAKVENEAVIEAGETSKNPRYLPEPRRFILDKPYWILMKRSNSMNPYFILGVTNTNLMERKK